MADGLALVGYGKMNRLIERLADDYGFTVAVRVDSASGGDPALFPTEAFARARVAIDFSAPDAVVENAVRIAKLGIPQVIGTTGWYDGLPRVREAVERHGSGLVYGANFSVGVNAFYSVVAAAASVLSKESGYDACLFEAHHRRKKDAPSGTALRILEAMRAAGRSETIDVASQRCGWIPGTHRVSFDSPDDTVELTHTARGRSGFAQGALKAARWILGRDGVWDFSDVWGEIG